MKNLALKHFQTDSNCSQCILKAFEEKYNYPLNPQIYKSLSAVNSGFGIGTVCSALIAGIIIFSTVFDEQTALRARLKLLSNFNSYFGTVNCSSLSPSKNSFNGCDKIIYMTAAFTEQILLEEGFLNYRF